MATFRSGGLFRLVSPSPSASFTAYAPGGEAKIKRLLSADAKSKRVEKAARNVSFRAASTIFPFYQLELYFKQRFHLLNKGANFKLDGRQQ